MFEGKELDKKLGEYGSVSVDLTPKFKLKVAVGLEVDLIAELEKLALKTNTPMDDGVVEWLKKVQAAAKDE